MSFAKSFEDTVIEKLDRITLMTWLQTVVQGKGVVTIADIARFEDVAISTLRQGGINRYMLPRFGESAYPTGNTRWTLTEYLAWYERDPYEKKQLYLEHLNSKTKEAR